MLALGDWKKRTFTAKIPKNLTKLDVLYFCHNSTKNDFNMKLIEFSVNFSQDGNLDSHEEYSAVSGLVISLNSNNPHSLNVNSEGSGSEVRQPVGL